MKNTTAYLVKSLSIGVVSILLSACGEGDGNTSSTPPPVNLPVVTPPVPPPVTSIPATPLEPSTPIKYPEPKKDIADFYLLGFFDHDGRAGEIRNIRPDLVGDFQAMIQFVI